MEDFLNIINWMLISIVVTLNIFAKGGAIYFIDIYASICLITYGILVSFRNDYCKELAVILLPLAVILLLIGYALIFISSIVYGIF